MDSPYSSLRYHHKNHLKKSRQLTREGGCLQHIEKFFIACPVPTETCPLHQAGFFKNSAIFETVLLKSSSS